MDKASKIYVAGHNGLVGRAIVKQLQANGYTHLIARSRAELDLTQKLAVRQFFQQQAPTVVFLAAAKVGGIYANNTYPAEFIHTNLAIQTNVIHEAWRAGVKQLLFLGSSCIYPKACPQPIKECYLLTDALELTNRPYALAKIAGIEMCWAYNRQYGTQYLAAMPTNLYGPGDNYHLQNSHVIPALLRKFHSAKQQQKPTVELWGSGKPYREFLYSEDLAQACVHLMQLPAEKLTPLVNNKQPPLINIGFGADVTIAELAVLVAETVAYSGKIVWDKSKPDGTARKLLNSRLMISLGWKATVDLKKGLQLVYDDFQRHYAGTVEIIDD